jgi:phenylacetate-CoA ligase
MKDHSIAPFPFIELVMCSSENLYPFQKALIEETLRVPVCNLYGNTERTVIAGNFPNCENLHVYPQYGFTEILDANGNECKEDMHGEVVSTNFTNPGYYLIRYKTSDIAECGGDECGCGWRYKVLKHIEGREQEFLISMDGKRVSMAALNVHSNIYDNVHQFQFEQYRPGEVLLKYIPKTGFSRTDENGIYGSIQEILGNQFSLALLPVTEIQRSGRGKYSMVKQNISVEKNLIGPAS